MVRRENRSPKKVANFEVGLRAVLAWLHRAGSRRWPFPLWSAAAGVTVMLLLAAIGGVPYPQVHDEFAYLLGADTFASGRLANAPHPLWPFFETIHVLSQPAYASKYQPAQSLFLALGQVLFGHPYYGVVLQNALLFAALCWMLQVWLAPGWALMGSALSVISIACAHYWAVSYWGGSLAALGGALLLVAWHRITAGGRFGYGWLAGIAGVLLFWTRPFEGGLLFAVLAVQAFLWFRRRSWEMQAILGRAGLRAGLVLAMGLGCQAVYNHAVTGSILELPYLLAMRQYHVVPVLWPQAMSPPKTYRLEILRTQFAVWEPTVWRQIRDMTGAQRILYLIGRLWDTVQGIAPLTFVLPVAFLFWRDRTVRWLLLAAVAGAAGLCLETWLYPHYLAPWFPLALLLTMLVLRNLLRPDWRGRRGGLALAAALWFCAFAGATLRAAVQAHYFVRQETLGFNMGRERARLAERLRGLGGRHVVIVRYSAQHNVTQEWVYNGANIDDLPVIWARDRGPAENPRLARYFQGRSIWLFEPDANPPLLTRDPEGTR